MSALVCWREDITLSSWHLIDMLPITRTEQFRPFLDQSDAHPASVLSADPCTCSV
jgi:hypothetical protein